MNLAQQLLALLLLAMKVRKVDNVNRSLETKQKIQAVNAVCMKDMPGIDVGKEASAYLKTGKPILMGSWKLDKRP